MPDGEEVLGVDLEVHGCEPRRLDIPHTALLGRQDLLRALGTSEAAWIGNDRDVQLLRARSSAILTGLGTVQADDPSLNVRLSARDLPGVESADRQTWRWYC